jgi:hypothetical protein
LHLEATSLVYQSNNQLSWQIFFLVYSSVSCKCWKSAVKYFTVTFQHNPFNAAFSFFNNSEILLNYWGICCIYFTETLSIGNILFKIILTKTIIKH